MEQQLILYIRLAYEVSVTACCLVFIWSQMRTDTTRFEKVIEYKYINKDGKEV